jgi:subtilase family protein
MRDPVFEAQFRNMKDAFARDGVQIDVAYQPNGEVDYLYEADRLLAPNDPDLVDRMARELPGLRRAQPRYGPVRDDLALLAIDDLEGGRMSVPEALRHLDARIDWVDGRPPFSPNHVFHVSRTCPAVEPERPCDDAFAPCPRVCTHESAREAEHPIVRIGVSDTGLLQDIAAFPWLAGVTGDVDPLAAGRPGGPPRIPEYTGHGTFIAGVARSMAPTSEIVVNDHFSLSGGELENVMIARLFDLAATFSPHIINLSAGTYVWQNWEPLGLDAFHQAFPDVTLVTAAGNDSTDRPFYPAALDWVIGVGALASDQTNRAWFSNFGDWVDVYALGEGMTNAYAVGEYTYQEPPRRPAKQNFAGMARWSGTSFSAPLVAGLIAARMARTGESSTDATASLMATARANPLPDVGPALHPCQHD